MLVTTVAACCLIVYVDSYGIPNGVQSGLYSLFALIEHTAFYKHNARYESKIINFITSPILRRVSKSN
jgi:hypothetical protein